MKYVLFCEDNPICNKYGCKGISEKFPEHEVISTCAGENSLERVASCIDDLKLVLTDGQLAGDMKGWDLARKLRAMGYKGPIVYIGLSPVPEDIKPDLFNGFSSKKLGTSRDLKEDFAFIAQQYLE